MAYTVDDYVRELRRVSKLEYESPEWTEQAKVVDAIFEALLFQEETADFAATELACDIMTLSMMGKPYDDPEVQREIALLEKAGNEDMLAEVRLIEWKKREG